MTWNMAETGYRKVSQRISDYLRGSSADSELVSWFTIHRLMSGWLMDVVDLRKCPRAKGPDLLYNQDVTVRPHVFCCLWHSRHATCSVSEKTLHHTTVQQHARRHRRCSNYERGHLLLLWRSYRIQGCRDERDLCLVYNPLHVFPIVICLFMLLPLKKKQDVWLPKRIKIGVCPSRAKT